MYHHLYANTNIYIYMYYVPVLSTLQQEPLASWFLPFVPGGGLRAAHDGHWKDDIHRTWSPLDHRSLSWWWFFNRIFSYDIYIINED